MPQKIHTHAYQYESAKDQPIFTRNNLCQKINLLNSEVQIENRFKLMLLFPICFNRHFITVNKN